MLQPLGVTDNQCGQEPLPSSALRKLIPLKTSFISTCIFFSCSNSSQLFSISVKICGRKIAKAHMVIMKFVDSCILTINI
jgi:predicted ester cyclase